MEVSNKVSYSSIGNIFTVRVTLDELSKRERLILMNSLLESFGIMQWAHDNPTESEQFQLAWKNVMDKNW